MSPRALLAILSAYGLLLVSGSLAVRSHLALRKVAGGETVVSVWRGGKLVSRSVAIAPAAGGTRAPFGPAPADGGTQVEEQVIASGPLPMRPAALFAASFVGGRDGVRARRGGKVAYVTPDDLLARQAYDRGLGLAVAGLSLGIDAAVAMELLAERLEASPQQVLAEAVVERVRMQRAVATRPPAVTAESLSRDDAVRAVAAAARYVARGVEANGSLRYVSDPSNDQRPIEQSLARHAGATFFLAQAAALTGDTLVREACLRAATFLRDRTLVSCGPHQCIGLGSRPSLGPSALALLAFAEIARTGLSDDFRAALAPLAAFLRGQQRPDGEFMHEYQRYQSKPVDVQGLYYSGEAVLALARVHDLLHDKRDRVAAVRGLAHLVGPAWSFFGNRYYFGEEHWTCEAMAELWNAAPDPTALSFCLRWAEYNRALQRHEGEGPADGDGGLGILPFPTPRLPPVASRCGAAVATLVTARKAGVARAELEALDGQIRHALAFLLRHQFVPGPSHLFADPASVHGAFPGSETDWQLRVDHVQHAGGALLRWLAAGP